MPVLTRRSALLSTLSLLVWGGSVAAHEPYVFDYHGWHIDASRVSKEPREPVVSAISRQLDIVQRLAIAQNVLGFMRTIPIWADTSQGDGGPAHYERANGVGVRFRDLDEQHPSVLHELLAAFQERQLGDAQADVQKGFAQARASGVWPADADILKDVRAFFATTATVYLFGNIDGSPYTQGRLREALPQYWVWLGEEFDGFHGCD
jgi:hypothetical protein